MGKSNIVIRQWLSQKTRFSQFVNGALFQGVQIFAAENMRKEDGQQGLIVRTADGKEVVIERYRDIMMTARTESEETKLIVFACENQDEIHYAMPVRSMLYDALSYVEQVSEIRRRRKKDRSLNKSAEFLSGIKKTDRLCPVITIIFYYGEERWDGMKDMHSLLGITGEEYKMLRKYIPNYTINLIDPREMDDLNCFGEDLQTVFEMLKYRKDKDKLLHYVDEHKEYFSDVDDETGRAIEVLLGSGNLIHHMNRNESGGVNMCLALDEYYQDGVNQGIVEGIVRGIESGRIQLIYRKLEKGTSVSEIAEWMEIEVSEVSVIKELMEAYPGEGDERIAERYLEKMAAGSLE